jgi:hypothetical protein
MAVVTQVVLVKEEILHLGVIPAKGVLVVTVAHAIVLLVVIPAMAALAETVGHATQVHVMVARDANRESQASAATKKAERSLTLV